MIATPIDEKRANIGDNLCPEKVPGGLQIRVRRPPKTGPAGPVSTGLRKRKPALQIKSGSVSVGLYGKAGAWTIYWREQPGGPRLRAMRADFAKAKAFAADTARDLANRQLNLRDFGTEDRARLAEADRMLAATGLPLLQASAEFAQARKLLADAGITKSLVEIAQAYVDERPAGVEHKNIPELIEEVLARKEREGKGAKYLRNLRQRGERFAERFTGSLGSVRPEQIDAWLNSLKVGLRTRRNYLNDVGLYFRYGQSQNYVGRDCDVLRFVEDPDVPLTDIRIYTPEEGRKLLAQAKRDADRSGGPGLVPFLAIGFFTGIRAEEMSSPDKTVLVTWQDINLKTGYIRVSKRAAKVKKQRMVEIPPVLAAWLAPYEKASGPICHLLHTGDALGDLGRRAGVPWVKNGPRKSCISYSVALSNDVAKVAQQSGNSAGQIEANYRELVTKEAATEWFNNFPPPPADANRIIQLNLFGG